MDIATPPGLYDLTPNDCQEPWRSSHIWQQIEAVIRKLCRDYGFEEVRTPMFEKSQLFLRSSGQESDIVSKELYRFEDKGGRDLALRPEGTAPILRSYNEWSQERQKLHSKLFYIGPMFRYDRPQAGRYRQHTQFGIEAIGVKTPEQDVEVLDLLHTLYQRLGLTDVTFLVNSLGTLEERASYVESLVAYYTPLKESLSADSQRRLHTNPLRILDSKDPKDIQINEKAPTLLESLGEESKEHFQDVLNLLDLLKIPYTVSPHLVRGLDYYNGLVFEVVTDKLGAQNSIGAGGRYDGLIKELGGQDLPAIGFGTGIERIIQTLLAEQECPKWSGPTIYLISLGGEAKKRTFLLANELRKQGIATQIDLSGRKLGKCMQRANQSHATYVAVIGESELEEGIVNLKEMSSGQEMPVALNELPQLLLLQEGMPEMGACWRNMMSALTTPNLRQIFLDQLSGEIDQTKRSVDKISSNLTALKELLGKK
jgi:histidyl-tRNA synthetase